MRSWSSYILLLFFLAYAGSACDDAADPSSDVDVHQTFLAVTNGILLDGTGAAPKTGMVVLIHGRYITAVDTYTTVDLPAGAKVIDARGGYVLPGFMNTHVHGGYESGNLRAWAADGVTTVRDLGSFSYTPGEAYAARNTLMRDGRNARLLAAGPIVTAAGGYGNFYVFSPADAATKTNALIDAGADIIKIAVEDDLQGRSWPMLSRDEIASIVTAAHARNKKVSAHVSRARHLAMAVAAGVDDVNHMIVDELPDSLITRMVAANTYWVPTLELWAGVSERHDLDWDVIAKDNLRRFVEAGGNVAVGTDFDGYVTPFELGMPMAEMNLMREAGMSPMEIIVAGTKNAAFVCDRENELGTIEPGKIADVIVVHGDPLADPKVLADVRTVVHNGEIIKADG